MANPRIAPQYLGMPSAPVHPTAWMHAQEQQENKRFWKYAPLIGILMLAVVTVRLHELIGPLRFIKPTFTLGVFGVGYLIMRSSNKARTSALQYLPTKLLIAYLIWITLLVPFAIWPSRAFLTVQTLIPCVLMVGALALCPPTRTVSDKVTWFYWLMIIAITLSAFILKKGDDGRLAIGGSYDSNDTAALLASAVPFALGIISRNRGKIRWGAIAGLLLVVAAIAASQSRGGFLALIAGCFVFGWGFKASKRIMMIVGMVVMGLVGWTFTGDEFRERMGTLLEIKDDYNFQTFDGRIAIWTRGVGYTLESPILGVGPGNFGFRDGQWLAQHGLTGKWSAAHNSYVQSFADLGFPGGILFLAMLIVASRGAYAHWRPKRSRRKNGYHRPEYLASIVALVVASFFLSFAYSPVVFGVLGLAALADRARVAEDRRMRMARKMSIAAAQAQQPPPSAAGYGLAVPFAAADPRPLGLPSGENGAVGG